jgi:hypothetical protein
MDTRSALVEHARSCRSWSSNASATVLECRGSGTTFEIIPVVSSEETQAVVAPCLDKA